MEKTGIITLVLIAANAVFSYIGFTKHSFFEQYVFEIAAIRRQKDYKRMIGSGFLHVSWIHLIFNMITLYSFGTAIENNFGIPILLIVYFASLIAGNLLALLIHYNEPYYRAVGASGAVCGLIFATIALFPGMRISLFILPIMVESWFFALVFILITIFGIRNRTGNIGHDAHLGGALIGMLVAIAFKPSVIQSNYIPILVVTIPSVIFIVLFAKKPQLFRISSWGNNKGNFTLDDRYNAAKKQREMNMDEILDKISRYGMKSLTKKEKEFLDKHSGSKRG